MQIYGLQKTTLVDYPGHVATTLFTGGCNFRCPYCQNSDLVVGVSEVEPYSDAEIFHHLQKPSGKEAGDAIKGTLEKWLRRVWE